MKGDPTSRGSAGTEKRPSLPAPGDGPAAPSAPEKETGGARSRYEESWSATPPPAGEQAGKVLPEGAAPDTAKTDRRGGDATHTAESGLRRLWHEHAPEIVLGAGTFVLLLGVLLAFLGMRAEQAANEVTPEDLARARAALEDESEIVARGSTTVDSYIAAVDEFVVKIAELEALAAEELAKGEEVAAAFGADLTTFNRLVNERNATLAQVNLVVQEVQAAAAKVDEAYKDLEELGRVAGNADTSGQP